MIMRSRLCMIMFTPAQAEAMVSLFTSVTSKEDHYCYAVHSAPTTYFQGSAESLACLAFEVATVTNHKVDSPTPILKVDPWLDSKNET